jgi:hypothetical protein
MRPFTRTIIELFDGKKRYLIPLYQRQYAWKVEPQLELLWEDIDRVANHLIREGRLHAPHFMGAMVIAQMKTYGRQVQAFEVIDGQQRLTTFQIMIAALGDVAKAKSSEYAAEVVKYLLNDGVMDSPDVERFKLWPSSVDRATFTTLISPDHPMGKEPENGSGSVPVAAAAYAFFREKIQEFVTPDGVHDAFRMEKLFEALKTGLAVVSIELEINDDPQTIFETLNSRGVDLSVGDLLRNFVFQRATGRGQSAGSLNVDALYETYWLPLDGWFWREGDTRGRLTKPRLDWLIADHLAMKKASIVASEDLYNIYRRWIIETAPFEGVEAELQSLTNSAAVYRRVTEQRDDDPLARLGRFARAFDVSTAMPLVIYLVTEAGVGDDLPSALTLIESYIVRRDLCGLPTGNYNRFFIEAIAKLRDGSGPVLDRLAQILAAGKIDTTRWPRDEEWRKNWLSRQQYKPARQPRLRYVFESLEDRKRTTASEVVKIRSDLTLEHIMPVKWREFWPIPGTENISPEEIDVEQLSKEADRDAKVQTMGNLTLLTQSLNSSVSNGPYSVKLPAVRAQSALVLNRELHDFDNWNDEMITLRGTKLFETARNIWRGGRFKCAPPTALPPSPRLRRTSHAVPPPRFTGRDQRRPTIPCGIRLPDRRPESARGR